jgi:PAS domain S-box-containing protein
VSGRSLLQAAARRALRVVYAEAALFVATAAAAAFIWFAVRGSSQYAALTNLGALIAAAAALALCLVSLRKTRKILVRYQSAFEKHSSPMWIFDVDTMEFLDVNEAALDHYGYTRAEFSSITARDIRPKEDVATFLQLMSRRISARHTEKSLHKKKDGTVFEVHITAIPLKYEGRNAELVVAQDVTLQKTAAHTQQRLEEATELIQAVFHTIPLAIWGIDLDGGVTFWNQTAESMFGWREEEVKGHPLAVIPAEQRSEYEIFAQKYRLGERLNGVERKRLRQDGTLLDCAIWSAPLRSRSGSIIGTVEILADITQRKNAEAELNRHVRKLAASNADLEQFAYAASHYLQEPIRAVITCTQMFERLAGTAVPSGAWEYLRLAREGALQSRDLVRALGEYWEIDHHPLQLAGISLHDAVAHAIDGLKEAIARTGTEILFGDLPTVVADLELTVKLFTHLLANSTKFRAHLPPRIMITARVRSQNWIISVQDNGIGIPPEFAERVFQIFNRLSRDVEGAGIGLSICKKIVELHEGRIWIVPSAGAGTTVEFQLPMASARGGVE